MNGTLLDTNVVILALQEPERLSGAIRDALSSGPISISVAVYWEVTLKSRKGNLDVGDLKSWWAEALSELQATVLPIRADHVAEMASLPRIHGDPFDRIIMGQAMAEQLVLASVDSLLPRYESERLQLLR